MDAQRHTGEKASETRVREIGLGSSLRRCVTANAVAVATISRSATMVGALRLTEPRLYGYVLYASISTSATSGRENCSGGSSPASSISLTLVPERKT